MDPGRFDRWGGLVQGDAPFVVAGPCSAESRVQVLETARALKRLGIGFFRAGVWKPRTRPGGFEGAGEPALQWLSEAGRETGMKMGTEVASPYHVEAALSAGLDFVWLGARTTANPFLVQEISAALSGSSVPVFVKNPVNPDTGLWSGAIERLCNSGVSMIAAVHRGVTSYVPMLYRNDPHWQMAIDMRVRFPRLPMLCDPSHIAGDRKYIEEISRKAMDLDFDGLFIESHISPSEALSDARQQLSPEELSVLLSGIHARRPDCVNGEYQESMEQLRAKIDEIDDALVSLLAERMKISGKIGEYKSKNNISILQGGRWDSVMARVLEAASGYGLDAGFVQDVFNRIHRASIECQENRE